MNTQTLPMDPTRVREIHELLQELDRHIGAQDASGRALLYQAKERIRLLMISIDRSTGTCTSHVPANDG